MTHEMRLHPEPFDLIESGIKTVEYRLNDEKRQELKIGDTIIFIRRESENKRLAVTITELKHYRDLLSMYTDSFDLYLSETYGTPQDAVIDTPYYSKEEIEKYGCIAIYFKK